MPTIYRKYRPQTFADITGQEHIVKTLTNEITNGQIAHAYLFSGPRGVGKTTLARLVAKSLNCPNRKDGQSEPCNECSSCKEITNGNNIDAIEVDAASHTQVDNVRENIIENAQFKPTKSKYKVFIIDEVHMLSNSSFNALLKTLEEPPAHVIFILATTEAHKILPTIISRCQRFTFGRIPYDGMKKRLEEICKTEEVEVDKKVIDRIINKSDGCLRDAESLLGQILSLNLKKITAADAEMVLPVSDAQSVIDFAEFLMIGQTSEALELIGRLSADGVNLEQFAYDLIEIWRTILLIKNGQAKTNVDYSEETIRKMRALSIKITEQQIIYLADVTLKRRQEIKTAPIPALPMELLAVEITEHFKNPDDTQNTPPSNAPIGTSTTPIEKPTHKFTDSVKNVVANIVHGKEIKTTLEDIAKQWPELLKALDVDNHSLTFVLRLCTPIKIDFEGVHVQVPYSFHKEKLYEIKNRQVVEQKLGELCGEKISIVCEVAVEDSDKQEIPAENISADTLAADFGGEVVAE